jgi:hypothetical protein
VVHQVDAREQTDPDDLPDQTEHQVGLDDS